MRPFFIQRDEDVSGVSGLGIVAEGVEFTDGTVSLRWLGERATTVIHPNIENVKAIHCHNGSSKIIWTKRAEVPHSVCFPTKCCVCGCPQRKTRSGMVCKNGHGGALALEEGKDPLEGWDNPEDRWDFRKEKGK